VEAVPRRRLPWLAVLLAAGGLALILASGGGWGSSGGRSGPGVTLVVAARPLDAGATVGRGDVAEVSVPASESLSTLSHAAADVVGRRLSVALPSGAPLSGALLAPAASASAAGHRLVRLQLDAAAVPPDAVVGALVDVVAAVSEGSDGGRVVTVATARMLAIAGGSPNLVTLDADVGGAARLVWAQTFAKSLHLLVRTSGADDQLPPDVAGLGR
jgi:pilus assembly protein CpaB